MTLFYVTLLCNNCAYRPDIHEEQLLPDAEAALGDEFRPVGEVLHEDKDPI